MLGRKLSDAIAVFGRRELREFVTVHESDRPWELPLAVAIAAGLPMLAGAWFGDLRDASLASMGAMTIVYLPRSRLEHRLSTIMAIAFAMMTCHALGYLGQAVPAARAPIITLISISAAMGCRYYRVVSPGALFFILSAAVGAYAPGPVAEMPAKLGVFALGCIGAVLVAALYSIHILRSREPKQTPPPPANLLNDVVIDSLVIGAFVGLSLGVAQLLALEKPYWVPVSCLAVIQGVSFRAVWHRQAQRITGTVLGLAVTWLLVRFVTEPWPVAIAVTVLTFCIEAAIVRHYAFAMLFVTPLTILLAEASTLSAGSGSALIAARFADTVVGAALGLLGGACLHSAPFRSMVARGLRTMLRLTT